MNKDNLKIKETNKLKMMLALASIKKGDITTATQIIFDIVDAIDARVIETINYLDVRSAAMKEGRQGEEGPIGPQGEEGLRGLQGPQGLQGKDSKVPGLRGLTGPQGPQGFIGKEGLSSMPGNDGSSDTPKQIADKLNSLTGVIDAKVIKNLPTILERREVPVITLFGRQQRDRGKVLDLSAGTGIVITKSDSGVYTITAEGGAGSGTVTSVSVVTANGISGTVATPTTTPAITLVLGDITPSSATISGLTASQLVATNASKTLQSLAVANYPSLTEISYVKGVTSAIQTQLNAKAATLSGTINEIAYFNSASTIASLAVATYPSLTELSYVKGLTSSAQTQITGKQASHANLTSLAALSYVSASFVKMTAAGTFALDTTILGTMATETAANYALVGQTMYIGTTAVTINRGSGALTLAGITLTTPDIGTPSAGVLTGCTGLPAASLVAGTLSGAFTMTKPVILGTNPTGATYTPATGAQTVTIDCAANNMHIVTGHADGTAITFAVSNVTNNQPFIISILQGGTTVSTITAWFATIRWAGGSAPTLTATLNKRDTFGFVRTGANSYDGYIIGQNC